MAARVLSLRRKLLYAAILSGMGVALLAGGLETALRLGGYGYSPHFFRKATLPGGGQVWRENRWCTAPYFSAALVRRPQPVRLPLEKAPGTYRIFILGSSAAMGDPEPSFSLARMLGAMLQQAWPERHFEVVNAAVTAINSHVVRGIAEDCAQLQPDLFIVYEGNNEVIGPFGPAGVFATFRQSEAAVTVARLLKTSRTGQLISSLARPSDKTGAPADWGGMAMFLGQQIAAGDPRLDAVRAHFRANLRAIADAGHRAGATTLACTVLTNRRDFAPFLSQHRHGLTANELATWQENFDTAGKLQLARDFSGAEKSYRAALAIDDQHAGLAYRLGRLALQTGRDSEAAILLQRALDLDTLRFRTDSSLNEIIRETGGSGAPGLELVDLDRAISAASPQGIPGDELIYEHVHLNLRGTYEAACQMLPHIAADLVHRGLLTGPAPEPFSYDEARLRLNYNTYEQAMIATELLNRFHKPPFAGQADQASRIHAWEKRAETARTLLARPDALASLTELGRRALAGQPDDWMLARNTGAMLVSLKQPQEALPLLERAAAWIDDDIDTLVALGWAHRALGHATESEAVFAQARALEPRYPGLPAPKDKP